MNDLVRRLSEKKHEVQANSPDVSVDALKKRIDLNYVHILFKSTGTEIGIQLDRDRCNFNDADFKLGKGNVHLEGVLTLNYDKVRCLADVELSSMTGTGILKLIENDEEYNAVLRSSKQN